MFLVKAPAPLPPVHFCFSTIDFREWCETHLIHLQTSISTINHTSATNANINAHAVNAFAFDSDSDDDIMQDVENT